MLPRPLALLAAGALLLAPLAPAPVSASPASDPVTVHAEKQKPKKPKKKDPRTKRGLYVDSRMPAAQQGPAYASIGKRPQALWFGNEYYPTSTVASVAREYTRLAEKAGKTPVLVVYSIPDRDCGQYSSGGLPGGSAYRQWVNQLAKGIKGSKPLVIVEPDAIPFYGQGTCANGSSRLALIKHAAKVLTKAGAWVYLDAGHSDWRPYDGRAALLKKAGMKYARGFSTNVSNFRTLASEQAYAAELLRGLRALGVKGKKYVVDTSRNGNPDPVNGDVINPTWARVGAPPKLRFQGPFDGTLWVKHPGESDGTVNSSAYSGQWCDQLADRLLGRPESPGC